MHSYSLAVFTMLAAVFTCLAEDHPTPVSVTIKSKAQTYHTLEDAVLEIHISNETERQLSVRTIDEVPPVHLVGSYEDGQPAIVSVPVPKNGTTRNVDYELGPKETKTYAVEIRALLGRAERLTGAGVGLVNVSVVFPVVRHEGGAYKVDHIHSNTVRIRIPAK